MRTALVDPRQDPLWRRLLDASPQATPFHEPAWIGLVARSYGFPVAAVVVLEDGEPVAGLPVAAVTSRLTGRRLVALPFTDRCAPVTAPAAAHGALEALWGAVDGLRRDRGVPLEVRAPFGDGETRSEHCLHLLDLTPGREAVEAGFSSQTRRNVRRAVRENVVVERRTDGLSLGLFYTLNMHTRRRLGVPTHPRAFIAGLEEVFAQGLGFVALARLDHVPVAAAVFLRARGKLVYKYGASHDAFLGARPNNALFADTIAWACDEGLEELDFGRTDLTGHGLRQFKASWGAREEPLTYTYAGGAPRAPGTGASGDLLARAIRRGPPELGRVIGEVAYRHMG